MKSRVRFCQQRVEPSTGLVHCLGDKVSGELLLEQILVFKRIMMLCKRHCSGVEPAVDYLGNTLHLLAALGAGDGDLVDIRTMEFYGLRLLSCRSSCTALHGCRWNAGVRIRTPRYLTEYPSNGYGIHPSPEHSPASCRNVPHRWKSGIQLMVLLLRTRSSFTAVILMNQDSLA